MNRLARWMPGIEVLRHYERSWLRHDVAAGLVLTTMLVPVGIAYATASGVPGIHGLYATIVPLLAYALRLTGDRAAYSYLQRSAGRFPCGEEFVALMRESADFASVDFVPLTFGIAYLYRGVKR